MHKFISGMVITVFIVIVAVAIAAGIQRATLEDTCLGVGVVIDKIHTPATSHTTYSPQPTNHSVPMQTITPAKYEVFVEIAGQVITANAETPVAWAQYSKGQEVLVMERSGYLGHYDYTLVPK